jgi:hypothetical protein
VELTVEELLQEALCLNRAIVTTPKLGIYPSPERGQAAAGKGTAEACPPSPTRLLEFGKKEKRRSLRDFRGATRDICESLTRMNKSSCNGTVHAGAAVQKNQ